MNITNRQTKVEKNILQTTLKLYRESVKNVPILRYSWIIVGTICILSLTAYFKLKNTDVFIYALVVLFISFLGFVFSFLTKTSDIIIRVALYILVYAIVTTMATAVCGFGYFIVKGEPTFYERYFPDQSKQNFDSIPKIIKYTIVDTVKVNPPIKGDHNVTNVFTPSKKKPSGNTQKPETLITTPSAPRQEPANIYTANVVLTNDDINSYLNKEFFEARKYSVYDKNIIKKWSSNDLARLIYKLMREWPLFMNKTSFRNRFPNDDYIEWNLTNIESNPSQVHSVWAKHLRIEYKAILDELVIRQNETSKTN